MASAGLLKHLSSLWYALKVVFTRVRSPVLRSSTAPQTGRGLVRISMHGSVDATDRIAPP